MSCGDLNSKYLSFLVTMGRAPLVYVHGNHDKGYEKTTKSFNGVVTTSNCVLFANTSADGTKIKAYNIRDLRDITLKDKAYNVVEKDGKIVAVYIDNGETPKDITVMRPVSIASRREMFPTLHVQPGETLVRVFRILKDEETHPMQRTFSFGVGSSVTDRTIRPQERPVSDVTVSLLNINRV